MAGASAHSTRSRAQRGAIAAATATAAILGGCSSPPDGPRDFAVAPGAYDQAFSATREVLRDMRFDLERVDAASGVITTKPHFSQGLFEPWDPTQSGFDQEWEDAMNMQAREVRVTFAPAEPPPAAEDAPPDLREAEMPLVGSVWVTVLRQHRAGRRLDAEWIGASSFAFDPELAARAGQRYLVPLRRDERLEARLAAAITAAIAPPASSETSPAVAPDE